MESKRVVPSLMFGWLLLAGSMSPPQPQAVQDRLPLESLLKRCAAYCERLSRASLNFVCRETIEETVYFGLQRADSKRAYWNAFRRSWALRNDYVYDYQLIQKAGFLEERRTLLEENGQARNEKNGVRFPTRYRIAEAYRNRRGEDIFPQSATVVVYEAFKFFTVETEVRY